MFIQDVNSKINKFHNDFSTTMEDMFIKNKIKERLINEFNKSDLEFKLPLSSNPGFSLGLDNYKNGDYISFGFFNCNVTISIQPINILGSNKLHYLEYIMGHGVTKGESNVYNNQDFSNYILEESKKHSYGFIKLKDDEEFKKLTNIFYNAIDKVLGDKDEI